MSTESASANKRKSAHDSYASSKKVKVIRSADKPAPLKSALKKSRDKKTKQHDLPETLSKPDSNETEALETSQDTVLLADAENEKHTDLTPDQTEALLAGFSSSEEEGEDHSDEQDVSHKKDDGIAVSSLPKPPVQNVAPSSKTDSESSPGVIYIGRIPHGFYEHQMRAYFSQFGTITHLRLARNNKTGASQHFGFIEFASAAVADIVCKTMDKYLLFGHILQVQRVPQEQIRENMWRGQEGRRARRPMPRNRLEAASLRKGLTRDEWEKKIGREMRKREQKKEQLKAFGYDFNMPEVKKVTEVPVKAKIAGDTTQTSEIKDDTKTPEHQDPPAVEVTVVKTVVEPAAPEAGIVAGNSITKKRSPAGKPKEAKKIVKKVKVAK